MILNIRIKHWIEMKKYKYFFIILVIIQSIFIVYTLIANKLTMIPNYRLYSFTIEQIFTLEEKTNYIKQYYEYLNNMQGLNKENLADNTMEEIRHKVKYALFESITNQQVNDTILPDKTSLYTWLSYGSDKHTVLRFLLCNLYSPLV